MLKRDTTRHNVAQKTRTYLHLFSYTRMRSPEVKCAAIYCSSPKIFRYTFSFITRYARRKMPTGRLGRCIDFLRSEEHTSELQSRGHLVCRLLLEKKNKKNNKT